jgi:hypothetical protein
MIFFTVSELNKKLRNAPTILFGRNDIFTESGHYNRTLHSCILENAYEFSILNILKSEVKFYFFFI